MSKFFDDLMESVTQMDEIRRGERAPAREFHVDNGADDLYDLALVAHGCFLGNS